MLQNVRVLNLRCNEITDRGARRWGNLWAKKDQVAIRLFDRCLFWFDDYLYEYIFAQERSTFIFPWHSGWPCSFPNATYCLRKWISGRTVSTPRVSAHSLKLCSGTKCKSDSDSSFRAMHSQHILTHMCSYKLTSTRTHTSSVSRLYSYVLSDFLCLFHFVTRFVQHMTYTPVLAVLPRRTCTCIWTVASKQSATLAKIPRPSAQRRTATRFPNQTPVARSGRVGGRRGGATGY